MTPVPRDETPVGSSSTPPTILLAEDDENLRVMLAIVLRREGRVVEFSSGARLREHLESTLGSPQTPAARTIVISDLRMPGLDGLALLRDLRAGGHHLPFILLTAFGSADVHAAAASLGVRAVLDKPFDFEELRQIVRGIGREARSPDEG
jgi:two-component system response regulator FixJ